MNKKGKKNLRDTLPASDARMISEIISEIMPHQWCMNTKGIFFFSNSN